MALAKLSIRKAYALRALDRRVLVNFHTEEGSKMFIQYSSSLRSILSNARHGHLTSLTFYPR